MTAFDGERALVIGLGVSGAAAARVLLEEGASVRISESGSREGASGAASVRDLDVEILDGGNNPAHLEGVTLVVTSPGVPQDAPILRAALDRGVPVWSELELGARFCRVPYVGITGTNGKTTTTEMLAASMRADGRDAVACGNVGHPFCLAAREPHDALAVEASSFQLRFSESFHPTVSVLLNLAPDHLDWHGSFEAYADAKARIFALQGPGDVHVGNRDDQAAAAISSRARARLVWTTLARPRDYEVGCRDDDIVSLLDEELVFAAPTEGGRGRRADAVAAVAAGLSFGLSADAVSAGIGSAVSLAHRGAKVAEAGGIRFVDDSKATNPHAALAAMEGLDHVVLIAGGRAKGVDLTPLAAAAPRLAAVVAIGEAADELVRIFSPLVPTRTAASIEEAARIAFDLAPGTGTVLLAPACASQDMFTDYRERGERFAAAAARIAEGVPAAHG
ncbi:MAG TPA: UDP-N-acetylmuramoyl-L-alanine--D-glutamate ligase [Actinomycetota bacterium]|jgi:UDP-N-acetylmuramoylalanine--D-glutamate ligase